MLYLDSCFSPAELTARWDDFTSPARFAGNDGVLDDIFIARRKDNRVYLIRKGRNTLDPFSTVFYGKILSTATGSILQGHFRKRFFDYLILVILLLLDVYIAYRGYVAEGFSASTTIVSLVVAVSLILLAIPLPPARNRYTAFLKKITEEA